MSEISKSGSWRRPIHVFDPQVRSQRYYRPPIQDGPSASSHSTEVLSVAKTVSRWETPMRFALRREMAELGVGLVIVEVLNGPINDDDVCL